MPAKVYTVDCKWCRTVRVAIGKGYKCDFLYEIIFRNRMNEINALFEWPVIRLTKLRICNIKHATNYRNFYSRKRTISESLNIIKANKRFVRFPKVLESKNHIFDHPVCENSSLDSVRFRYRTFRTIKIPKTHT